MIDRDEAAHDARAWLLPAARGAVALAVGLPIIFIPAHGAIVGLVAFAVLAALTGVALVTVRDAVPRAAGPWPVVAGAASVVAGTIAGILAVVLPDALALGILVAIWAAVAGLAELAAWWRVRGTTDQRVERLRADWRTVAAFTLVLGVAAVPASSNPLVLTGLIGAYAVIVGVFHAIAALSARPARASIQEPA